MSPATASRNRIPSDPEVTVPLLGSVNSKAATPNPGSVPGTRVGRRHVDKITPVPATIVEPLAFFA